MIHYVCTVYDTFDVYCIWFILCIHAMAVGRYCGSERVCVFIMHKTKGTRGQESIKTERYMANLHWTCPLLGNIGHTKVYYFLYLFFLNLKDALIQDMEKSSRNWYKLFQLVIGVVTENSGTWWPNLHLSFTQRKKRLVQCPALPFVRNSKYTFRVGSSNQRNEKSFSISSSIRLNKWGPHFILDFFGPY